MRAVGQLRPGETPRSRKPRDLGTRQNPPGSRKLRGRGHPAGNTFTERKPPGLENRETWGTRTYLKTNTTTIRRYFGYRALLTCQAEKRNSFDVTQRSQGRYKVRKVCQNPPSMCYTVIRIEAATVPANRLGFVFSGRFRPAHPPICGPRAGPVLLEHSQLAVL